MQNVDTTKYVIYADITAEGIVERPDVVGAIFGQTEGLLGSDLDLRDLQKTGRLGRIDVQIASSGGKSNGTISIPSSFDKVETAILAAALETIDRVGPCIARIAVNRIEDVRASKRKYVIERAKRILVEMFDENILETEEITEEIKQSVRVEEIIHLGKGQSACWTECAGLGCDPGSRGPCRCAESAQVRHQERRGCRRNQCASNDCRSLREESRYCLY